MSGGSRPGGRRRAPSSIGCRWRGRSARCRSTTSRGAAPCSRCSSARTCRCRSWSCRRSSATTASRRAQVFINQGCFSDLGGITLGDRVLVGLRVPFTSAGHPVEPASLRRRHERADRRRGRRLDRRGHPHTGGDDRPRVGGRRGRRRGGRRPADEPGDRDEPGAAAAAGLPVCCRRRAQLTRRRFVSRAAVQTASTSDRTKTTTLATSSAAHASQPAAITFSVPSERVSLSS